MSGPSDTRDPPEVLFDFDLTTLGGVRRYLDFHVQVGMCAPGVAETIKHILYAMQARNVARLTQAVSK